MRDLNSQIKSVEAPYLREGRFAQARENGGHGPLPVDPDDAERYLSVSPVGHEPVTPSSEPSSQQPGGRLQRTLNLLRVALPYVQRILPLLDGNVASAVSNLMAPPTTVVSAPPVNLAPIESALAELRTEHHELRSQVLEQNVVLQRVEEQLEMVSNATDRNTRAGQEMLEDLKALRKKKIGVASWVAWSLFALSVMVNVILLLHIRHILP